MSRGQDKLRVLFVISSLSIGGGAQHVFERIINGCGDSIEPVLLVFEKRGGIPTHAKVFLANSGPIGGVIKGARTTIQRAIQFRRLVKEIRPDAVIGTQTVANLMIFLSMFLGRPGLARRCILRCAYDPFDAARLWKEARYRLLAEVERRIAVLFSFVGYCLLPSYLLKRKFEEKTPIRREHTFAIPNFCDVAEVRRLSLEPVDDWSANPFIISVGRLDPEKNPGLLLRAFAKARSVGPCKLTLVGSGQLQPKVQAEAKMLGVSQDVMFVGDQRNPFKFIARSKAFVLSSDIEGMPNALIEAMAIGIPSIATDTDGAREILGDHGEFGIIIPRNDVEALAESLTRIQRDAELHSHYARMAVVRSKDFDARDAIPRYIALFRQASGRKVGNNDRPRRA